jgi:hypothetical protein
MRDLEIPGVAEPAVFISCQSFTVDALRRLHRSRGHGTYRQLHGRGPWPWWPELAPTAGHDVFRATSCHISVLGLNNISMYNGVYIYILYYIIYYILYFIYYYYISYIIRIRIISEGSLQSAFVAGAFRPGQRPCRGESAARGFTLARSEFWGLHQRRRALGPHRPCDSCDSCEPLADV